MTDNMELGEILKRKRRSLGLSQKQVANALGLKSGQSISDWERMNCADTSIKNLKKLIELYELDFPKVVEQYIEFRKHCLEKELREKFSK